LACSLLALAAAAYRMGVVAPCAYSVCRARRVLYGPLEGVVGNLLPAFAPITL
jgi:hypothetical protein